MRFFLMYALLMSATLFPAAHVVPFVSAMSASSSLVPIVGLVQALPDYEACVSDEGKHPYTVIDNKQVRWERNQRTVVTLCRERENDLFASAADLREGFSKEMGFSAKETQEALEELYLVRKRHQILRTNKLNPHEEIDKFEREIKVLCPEVGDSLESYVSRVQTHAPQCSGTALSTIDLMSDTFSSLPWHLKRYLLAVNVELGLLKPNDEFSFSALTPLDHAVREKDEELFFRLWDKGARKPKYMASIYDAMLESSDKRSLEVLKWIHDEGNFISWPSFKWAINLDPAFVLQKAYIIMDAEMDDVHGEMRPSRCVQESLLDELPGHTPGAKALKDFLMKHHRGCSIL